MTTEFKFMNRRVYRDMTSAGEFFSVKKWLPNLQTEEAKQKMICWTELFIRPHALYKIEGGGDYPEPVERYTQLSYFSDICQFSYDVILPAKIGFVVDSDRLLYEDALRRIIETRPSDDAIIHYSKEDLVDFFQKILDDVPVKEEEEK